MDNLVRCPYCGDEVTERGMGRHQQVNVKCQKAQRVHDLCSRHFVLVHKNSPIYSWVTTYLRDTPIWEYDNEDQAWFPSWFCDVWYRTEKDPSTGKLACAYQPFLESLEVIMASERKMNSYAVHARLLDIGFFDQNGGIYKSDCQTIIWEPPTGRSGAHRNGTFTKDDFEKARSTMLGKREPFTGTRYNS